MEEAIQEFECNTNRNQQVQLLDLLALVMRKGAARMDKTNLIK